MKLLAATGNPHKLEEFRRILEPLSIEIVTPTQAGANMDIEETGTTFLENAYIKAQSLFRQTGIPTLADDSGLCVDALDGRPGVYSSRYGGENTPHSEKIRLLLGEMKSVPQPERTARFVAAVCCVFGPQQALECEGICEGSIGFSPVGSDGFGYDPIFMVDTRSYAQLSPEEKDAISHRGVALRKMAALLQDYQEQCIETDI